MKAQKLKQGEEYKVFNYYKYGTRERRARGRRTVDKFILAMFDGRNKTVFEDNAKRYVYRFIDRAGFHYVFFSYELKTDVIEV